MKERTLFGGVVAFLFVVGVLPLLMMLFGSLYDNGRFSLTAYKVLFTNTALRESLKNSFLLALTVATASTSVGVGLGILLGKSDLRFAKFFTLLLVIPLLIPPYILAFSWADLFGEWFFGFWGVVFVLFTVYLPIAILVTMLYLRQIDPHLEEAALQMSSWKKVLWLITLPLIRPAIIFAFLLVFILAFGEFSVANFLRYPVFSTQSFVYFSAFYDFRAATAAALPIVAVVAMVFWMQRFLAETKMHFIPASLMQKIRLLKWRLPLFLFVLLIVMLFVITPLSMLVFKTNSMESFLEAGEKALDPLGRSLLFAMLGATLLSVFGFLSAYIIHKRLFRWYRWLDGSILLLFALPASLFGIALILFWNRPYTNFIYATPLILLIGYLGKYLALTTKITETKLVQIPQNLMDAAALSGASWYQTLWYIILPLSKEVLLVGWVVGFIFSLRENTMTMLLYPPGSDTLPVYIFTQMANGKASLIAALCLIMITATLLPLLFLWLYNAARRRDA